MKNLMETALKRFDQAESYSIKNNSLNLHYQNKHLQKIDTSLQRAVTLRGIKDGHLGFAYTRNLLSLDKLISNAEKALLGKVKAEYKFPYSPLIESLSSYESSIENLGSEDIAEECLRITNYLAGKTDAEIEIYAGKEVEEFELVNSSNTHLNHKNSSYYIMVIMIYPGSAWGMEYMIHAKSFRQFDRELMDKLIERYRYGNKIVTPESGNMQVMFTPSTIFTLTWRLGLGCSSSSFYHKTTPIADKLDMRIFDNKISFFTDPLNDEYAGCRPFDDEGVVCHRHFLIDDGLFKNRFNDLDYASRLSEKPTGHGFRSSMTALPQPTLRNLFMRTGTISFEEMIKGIKKGIILESILGAHSGNLANGDFSIGVSPALYVENGQILGRLKEGMVSGNIYKVLKKVDAVENKLHAANSGFFPAILLDDVNVSV